jgi:hypothetical protein
MCRYFGYICLSGKAPYSGVRIVGLSDSASDPIGGFLCFSKFGFLRTLSCKRPPGVQFRRDHPKGAGLPFRRSSKRLKGLRALPLHLAPPADKTVAKVLRLQTQRDNVFFVLETARLSDEQKRELLAQLSVVQDELVRLTGGMSLNRVLGRTTVGLLSTTAVIAPSTFYFH